MDCIILAGDREHYHHIDREKNKAFLPMGKATILGVMLQQVVQAPEITRISIVGPTVRLRHLIEDLPELGKPIHLVDQRRDLVSNVQAALEALANLADPEDPVLILPSDIPLITAREISDFLTAADTDNADYITGMVPREAMEKFYPSSEKPGVKMAYFHLSEGLFRISNLHMARPSAVRRLRIFRTTYAVRYQKKFHNMIIMALSLAAVCTRSPSAVFFYMGMQLATLLRRLGLKKIAARIQKPLHIPYAEKGISKILGTRFKVAITNLGGAAVDVDNIQDYHVIHARFDEWVAAQQ